jgi:signal transduction histidine kinase
MLHEFLYAQRSDLIERCRAKVAVRSGVETFETDRAYGVPHFIDQLIQMLQAPQGGWEVSAGGRATGQSVSSEMGISAARHGRELARRGYSVEQVIHDYGDLCQAITDAAFAAGARIEVDEFRTLNLCLDNAIADSVSEWAYQNELVRADQSTARIDRFVYQLRKLIHTASLAVIAIKAGNVGISGATGAVLDRSLIDLRTLLDSSIGDLRGSRPVSSATQTRMSVADFVVESKISASLEAQSAGCTFSVSAVDPTLAVVVDREMLFSAVGQLLNNAFKCSRTNGQVAFGASASGNRIQIHVEDSCGGLAAGQAEEMLRLSVPDGPPKAGGLAMCQRDVQANSGILSVRDVPGSGCIFTIDLPRRSFPKGVLGDHVHE